MNSSCFSRSKISIAMCTFNGQPYLEPQIESILSQTADIYEIVIVDDGSTDGTCDILGKYQDSHPDLINFHRNEENLGVTKNFEKAISLCEGDVICISDQDDIWKEDKVEQQLNDLPGKKHALTFHDSVLSGGTTTHPTFFDTVPFCADQITDQTDLFKFLLRKNCMRGATSMFTRDLLDWVLPIPDEWYYDYYIAVMSAILGHINPVNKNLSEFRQHSDQDLGAKESFYAKVVNELDRDVTHYHSRYRAWKLLFDRVKEINADHFTIPCDIISESLYERQQLAKHRKTIYSSSAFRERMRAFYQIKTTDGYDQFSHSLIPVKDFMFVPPVLNFVMKKYFKYTD